MAEAKRTNDDTTEGPAKTDPYDANAVLCEFCGQRFGDKRAMAAHQNREHGVRNPVLKLVQSTTCWGCNVNFCAVSRIVQHLSKHGTKNKCCADIKGLNLPFFVSKYSKLVERQRMETRALAAKGKRAHFAEEMCVRASGPCLRR